MHNLSTEGNGSPDRGSGNRRSGLRASRRPAPRGLSSPYLVLPAFSLAFRTSASASGTFNASVAAP